MCIYTWLVIVALHQCICPGFHRERPSCSEKLLYLGGLILTLSHNSLVSVCTVALHQCTCPGFHRERPSCSEKLLYLGGLILTFSYESPVTVCTVALHQY